MKGLTTTSLNNIDMFQNYFKIGWRNLLRNKGYSVINILGLATGMAVALLISLWIHYQLEFDGFQSHEKNIALIMKKTFFNNEKGVQTGVMLPLYDELKNNYPEVKHITRLDWGDNHSLMSGQKKLIRQGHYADPDFLKMFSFPLVEGNQEKALQDPHSIVLTESTATALFGSEEALGKMITLDNENEVIVTAVLKDVPANSSITFDFLVPYELNIITNEYVKNAQSQWQNNFLQNFVELQEGVSMTEFSKRIEHIVQEKTNDDDEGTLFVHPMAKWHLYSDFKDWKNTGGAIEYVRLFAVIGIFVLLIACINFINLNTARSEKRVKEIGIRKVSGSHRRQLIVQFLVESVMTAFIAFILSLLIIRFSLPFLKNTGFSNITFDQGNLRILGISFVASIITGLLAGFYPAIYLSGFAPLRILKGSVWPMKKASLPREILVVVQFSFSISLIIGTLIVFQQIQHAKNRPLGYNPRNLLTFNLSSDLQKNYQALKHDLQATGYVEAVSKSSSPMTAVYNQWNDFSWEGKDPDSRPLFAAIMVDYEYDITSGIKMKQGRFFSREFSTDSNAVILNEASVKVMGFKNPIGNIVSLNDDKFTVIGVSENMVMQDPFKSVMPAIILLRPYFLYQGFIRLKRNVEMSKALEAIQPVFEKYNPAYPFDFRFTEDEFTGKFQDEYRIGRLSGIFAIISILISCLGLFGLASYMAELRTKEIGIRKVIGASVFSIWKMLSKDFVLLVVISCVIALPTAYYLLNEWLKKYEYRIGISWWIMIATVISALTITLLTVSYQTMKAATMNPVHSLRSE